MTMRFVPRRTHRPPTSEKSLGLRQKVSIASQQIPYMSLSLEKIHSKVPKGLRLEMPSSCSEEMTSLLSTCWSADPELRPTFDCASEPGGASHAHLHLDSPAPLLTSVYLELDSGLTLNFCTFGRFATILLRSSHCKVGDTTE